MVENGLLDAGYNYINIDDGFQNGRNADGTVNHDNVKFPNGMRAVADYIHSKGLKAGIYSDAGDNTCGSANKDPYGLGVGLYGHEAQDFQTYFVDWDYDFIKVDYCGGSHLGLDERRQYTNIANAIKNCGKPDARLNICRWAYPGTWVTNLADSWRTTGDIYAAWESLKGILSENLYMSAYCRDGHYNDMDMLEVGRGMTAIEDQTHFGMWCIMSSPLLIGCDMRNLSGPTKKLLTNKELIALNQDPLHLQAHIAYKDGDVFVLVKDIETKYGKKRAVALYNPAVKGNFCTLDFAKLELGGNVLLRDLIENKDQGTYADSFKVMVPGHGVKIYLATADERLERKRYEAETGYISDYQEIKNNQTERTGVYVYDDSRSGGLKVGWLGFSEENDLVFDNVYSANGGEYELTIGFVSGEDRKIHVDVNGEKITVLNGNTDRKDETGTPIVSVKVLLNPGENTVRLYCPDYFMPDIDYMDVEPVGGASVAVIASEQTGNVSYYDLGGRKIANPGSGNLYIRRTDTSTDKVVL